MPNTNEWASGIEEFEIFDSSGTSDTCVFDTFVLVD